MRRPVQLELPRVARDGTWRGGARKGAGRKPNGARAGVSHRRREVVTRHHPVHITVRFRDEVRGLRNRHAWAILRRCFHAGCTRFGFRLNQVSVQRSHAHLIAEADDARALARGMQGLTIRIARAVNQRLRRKGKVVADRFHAHVLRTPRETRYALAYCLLNARRHAAQEGVYLGRDLVDPYSSATYFLRDAVEERREDLRPGSRGPWRLGSLLAPRTGDPCGVQPGRRYHQHDNHHAQ